MSTPIVTVGLAMRNSVDTIEACLRSLLAQTYPYWELRLYDDASADASVALANAFGDPRIIIESDGRRRGLGARMNQAIDAARGAYFARMDADDIAYPTRLERQVAFLDERAEVDLVGTAMMVFDNAGTPLGLHPVHATHAALCANPYRGFYLPHPTWMGRISWFRRWRYDPSYEKAQDQDLLRRAYRESRFAGIEVPLVGYRQDQLSIAKSWRSRYHVCRSLLATGQREGRMANAVIGVAGQGARAIVDTLAIGSGLGVRVLRHRARPFETAQADEWASVWRGSGGAD